MSPKAKKYRRNVTPSAAVNEANSIINNAQTTPLVSTAPKTTAKVNANAILVPTAQSFGRDLVWIGLTTLVVVILMVVAFYAVPR
jgi:hypothetical protein